MIIKHLAVGNRDLGDIPFKTCNLSSNSSSHLCIESSYHTNKTLHLNGNSTFCSGLNLQNLVMSCLCFACKQGVVFRKSILWLLSILMLSATLITSSYGSLQASTANTIHGTAPYLLLSNGEEQKEVTTLDELLGFRMPKQDGTEGEEQIDVSMAGTSLTAPAGMKYSDVIALVTADGVLHNITGVTVGDADGDAAIAANATLTGQMLATWYDGQIQVTNLNQVLSVCGGPYTLKVEIPTSVDANTAYGDPRTNRYGTHSGVTYTFTSTNQALCYLKPADMTVYTSGVSISGGYNTSVFNNSKGFKAGSGFPSTGFKMAQFSLIGPGTDQSMYRCTSVDDGGKITLSGSASTALGENCMVTYNSATKAAFIAGGTPTIVMQYYNDSSWITIDSYSIPQPVRWAIAKGTIKYGNTNQLSTSTLFPALDECRGVTSGTTTWQEAAGQNDEDKTFRQQFMYRRNELTNSLTANESTYPENTSPPYIANYFSRDVDGTFMGEWGYVYKYTGSGWTSNSGYWTAEAWSTVNQFHVLSDGRVSNSVPNNSFPVTVCRGE